MNLLIYRDILNSENPQNGVGKLGHKAHSVLQNRRQKSVPFLPVIFSVPDVKPSKATSGDCWVSAYTKEI